MKSIAFVLPTVINGLEVSPSIFERFQRELTNICHGFTKRSGARYSRNPVGSMSDENVLIYEVAFGGETLDAIGEMARQFAAELSTTIETKIDGETILFGIDATTPAVDEKPLVSDWPTDFDIAVQTVIGPELHAAQDFFHINPIADARSLDGTIYYRGKVVQGRTELSVVVCCQSSAGNDAAAVIAERLISQWHPKAIFLMGIAAGRRGKCKIGDVVTPRVIIDDTEGVLEAQERLRRPKIYPPPFAMIQQLQNFRFDRVKAEWHERLRQHSSAPIPPNGLEQVYLDSVASVPSRYDAAIYSSNLLLRDGEYLEKRSEDLHQQIRIGEMEAAGFGRACNERGVPIPWFVVRGVSDFGDKLKSDDFHTWAANAAASFLYFLIRDGINISLFQ